MSTSAGADDHVGLVVDSASATKVGQEKILYIGEIQVPVRSVGQCITCQCPDRELIERGYMMMRSYRTIAESLPTTSTLWEDDRAPDGVASIELVIRRIGDHFREGHGNADQNVARQVMEAVAQAQGVDIESMGGTIIHEFGVLTEVMRRGFEDFLKDDKPIPIGSTLRAVEMLLRYKETAQGADAATFQRGIDAMVRLMAQYMGQDELAWAYSQMEEDPDIQRAFRAITAQAGT